jgi:hypothetical protein
MLRRSMAAMRKHMVDYQGLQHRFAAPLPNLCCIATLSTPGR